MELADFIKQANRTYRLRLDRDQQVAVHRRLVGAGFGSFVKPHTSSKILDAILDCADHIKKEPRLAMATAASYGSLKVEAAAPTGECVRCHGRVQTVMLVNDRDATYCASCNITLPNRA